MAEIAPPGHRCDPEPTQSSVNRAVYESRGAYRYYLSEALLPPESACLLKYQPDISGCDVLDIGVGAGRTARYLAPLARRYEAVDFSSVMVRYMKRAMPEVSARQADFRDLSIFQGASFDFVFAPNNVVDTLSHEDRQKALKEAHRVLRPGGLLAITSHNLQYKQAFLGPQLTWCADPVRFAYRFGQYLVCWRNHLRMRRRRKITQEYALINDGAHHFTLLHYYVARSTMTGQLNSAGFELEEIFDTFGYSTPPDADDREYYSLLYVARKI